MPFNPGQCELCNGAAQISHVASHDLDLVECARCGRYRIEPFLSKRLLEGFAPGVALHRLSAATRRASDAGERLLLTVDTVEEVNASVAEPRTVLGKLDRYIELLAESTPRLDGTSSFDPSRDYPLGPFLDAEEVESLTEFATDRGWVDPSAGRLTLSGWQRADEIRQARPRSRHAFVAMSFAEDLRPVFDAGFRQGIEASKYFTAVRVDQIPHNGKICDEIVAGLRAAALVVADATYLRPSVFFEAGWAYGLGVPVIWTCREDFRASLGEAFDTRQYNHILWSDASDLAAKLDARIRATVLPPAVLPLPQG